MLQYAWRGVERKAACQGARVLGGQQRENGASTYGIIDQGPLSVKGEEMGAKDEPLVCHRENDGLDSSAESIPRIGKAYGNTWKIAA